MAKKKVKKPIGLLIVASKVKAYVKSKGMRIGVDALGQLSNVVAEDIDRAIDRATDERRQTIKDRDVNHDAPA